MKVLLDTHFVVWIVTGADRLSQYPWIEKYHPCTTDRNVRHFHPLLPAELPFLEKP